MCGPFSTRARFKFRPVSHFFNLCVILIIMITAIDYSGLSISERIQLVEDIWDSIAGESPDAFPLSEAQKTELYRRANAHSTDPGTAIPWEQVRAKLFQRPV